MDRFILFGCIAGFLEIIGTLPYYATIFSKKTKPSRATWFIWSILSIVLFATYYSSGARETLWQPGLAMFFNASFAILSLKYGVGGTTKLDIFCFLGALLSLTLWYITQDPVVGLTVIIVVAVIGSIPTIVKVWKDPQTENSTTWLLWALANVANLFAIRSWDYEIALYPIEATIVISLIFFLTLRKI